MDDNQSYLIIITEFCKCHLPGPVIAAILHYKLRYDAAAYSLRLKRQRQLHRPPRPIFQSPEWQETSSAMHLPQGPSPPPPPPKEVASAIKLASFSTYWARARSNLRMTRPPPLRHLARRHPPRARHVPEAERGSHQGKILKTLSDQRRETRLAQRTCRGTRAHRLHHLLRTHQATPTGRRRQPRSRVKCTEAKPCANVTFLNSEYYPL